MRAEWGERTGWERQGIFILIKRLVFKAIPLSKRNLTISASGFYYKLPNYITLVAV